MTIGNSNTGFILLSNPIDPSGGVYYNSILQVVDSSNVKLSGNLIPSADNTYTLGASGSAWKSIYMGPGTLNILGPTGATNPATLGSDLAGVAYTQFGFATPFLNVGPSIDTYQAVGGWQIYGTPNSYPPTDLVAQLNTPSGTTGPQYSLIFSKTGATGSQGSQGFTGPTGSYPQLQITRAAFTGTTGGLSGNYYIDSYNLGPVTINSGGSNLIYASFQCFVNYNPVGGQSIINNISTTIMRDGTGMSGTTYNGRSINLALGSTGDVFYPLDNDTNVLGDLATSLYTFSIDNPKNNGNTNALTVNMQTIDSNLSGTPITVYYAIRVSVQSATNSTTSKFVTYGNVRLSSVKLV